MEQISLDFTQWLLKFLLGSICYLSIGAYVIYRIRRTGKKPETHRQTDS